MRIYDLKPGVRVRIKRTFRDFDRVEHEAGRELRLVSHDAFLYDDGHTLEFDDGTVIRLGGIEPDNRIVMDNEADAYREVLPDKS